MIIDKKLNKYINDNLPFDYNYIDDGHRVGGANTPRIRTRVVALPRGFYKPRPHADVYSLCGGSVGLRCMHGVRGN